ncbi:sialidase-1 [Haloplanus vescus]|uniref:Sialidase-1 n=2 Tax=Haloplanus vescus TaxID=555874 RepID=A0A1H3WVY4_9EURY|nr:NEW3 domain-containing protein [Haloplanus vescus]SDZ91337.1 sialidase-1 [Haloplanus vescus]
MTRKTPRNSRSVTVALTAVLVMGLAVGALPTMATAQTSQSGNVIGHPDVTFATSSGSLSAGTTTDLTVSVVNRGLITTHGPSQYEDEVMTARGLTFEVDDGNAPVTVQTGQVSLGNFQTGSAEQTVSITVPKDAEPGTYRLPVEYEYSHTRHVRYGPSGPTEGSDTTRTETDSITIRIEEDARFEIVGTDATTQVGDDSDISFTLRNTGSEIASGASVTAESKSSSLTFESGDTSSTASVGDWEAGTNRTLTYNAALESGSAVRDYALDLVVDYDDIDGISRTADPLTTTVESTPAQSFAFSDVSSSLRVGEDGDIVGTLENTGSKPVRSVAIRPVNTSEAVIPSEDSTAVGSLDPGESTSFRVPFEITSEAVVGEKLLDVEVRYRDGEGDQRTYDKLDLPATIEPERDEFELAVSDRTITAGSSRVVTVEVTNNLDETVTDMEARLFADDPLSAGASDTSYIESLAPGESATLAFEVTAASAATAGSTYPISFDVRYTDSDGNTHLSDTFRKPLDAVEPQNTGGPPLPLVLGAGIVVVGGIVLLYRRRQ